MRTTAYSTQYQNAGASVPVTVGRFFNAACRFAFQPAWAALEYDRMKPLLYALFTLVLAITPQQNAPGGTGKISGIVVQAESTRPIDGVQIILAPVTSTAGGPLQNQVGTYTDLQGRFEIGDLAAGRYRIQWTRPGYFTPPVGTPSPDNAIRQTLKEMLGLQELFVATPPAATSVTVDVASGENLKGFVFALIPGGVISGRLFDPMGNSLVNTPLSALTVSYEDGKRVLRPGGANTSSDDRGQFRLFGLRPGEYYIRADYRPTATSVETVRSYFPGVPSIIDAMPIVVNESGESPGADFRISNTGTVTISGNFRAPENVSRAAAQFYLLRAGSEPLEDPYTISFPNTASGENRALGQFELRGVPPGQYSLVATIGTPAGAAQAQSYNGRVTLNVGAQDIRGLSVELHALADLKGRVVLEDGSAVQRPLVLRPRDVLALAGRIQTVMNSSADGSFIIPRLPESRYSITQNSNDSCVIDIQQGGKSVYDDGFIGGMDAEPITVILSNSCGAVQVQIVDDKQLPVSNAFVSLVPSGDHRKNPLLYKRSIFDVAASKYPPIPAIPPGEYRMFAWDNIPPNAELNAAFLAKFEDRGVSVTVRHGETVTVQIPLIRTKNQDR